jgi:hypothetical protein
VRLDSVGLDRHSKAVRCQALLVQLGAFPGRPRHDRSSGGVDLVSVLMGLRAGHTGNDATERHLNVVERVALAIKYHNLVGRQRAQPLADLFLDVGQDHCLAHSPNIAVPSLPIQRRVLKLNFCPATTP